MIFTLRDTQRNWFLASSLWDAKLCPGKLSDDRGLAKAHLERLIRDPINLAAVKSLLANGPGSKLNLPVKIKSIRVEMHRRIENKLWFLIQGPVLEIKASSPGKVEPEWIPLDAADWSPDPKSEDSPKEEATPTILAEYEIESPPTLEYGFELEMADGIQSEYEVET